MARPGGGRRAVGHGENRESELRECLPGKFRITMPAAGFGFIIPDDGGADVFVHANYLVNADLLKRDQRVSFEVVNDDRRCKVRADKVRVL
jgi:CspA family cold shock protein